MSQLNKEDFKICIVGLGYVGLPLAVRFASKYFNIVGYDINETRIKELKLNSDSNDDISVDNLTLLNKNAIITSNIADIKDCNFYIVTVPTPINLDKTPNLKPLVAASELVGSIMKKNSIVIYESTVYPGVTDEVCTPILEKKSKLKFNKDFATGYSPERIVPGEKINTIEKIKKVVSGSNKQALKKISFLYSSIIDAGIHEAPSIKVAEAAKVTENIQRDVNIALINEMHQLYSALNIDTHEVINAASTKWNFMKLKPGLVGGHCISIDPYYLMHKSKMEGYEPTIMSAARKLNDEMSSWAVKEFLNFCNQNNVNSNSKVTIFGYTFKENCSDTRNTRVLDVIDILQKLNFRVNLWDPLILDSDKEMLKSRNVEILDKPSIHKVIFLCVYHDEILEFLQNYDGFVYDYRKLS